MGTTSVSAGENHDHVLRALGRAIFFLSFPLGFVSFALPIYGKELGATALEIGTLFSAFFLVSTLLRPLLGRLVDRYGRRPFLLLGVAGYVGTALLFLLAGDLLMLLAARLVEGAAQSFLWLSAYAIVADCSPPDERGRRFGRVEAQLYRGVLVGAFVGFPCLGYLGIVRGWTVAFAVYTLLAAAATSLAIPFADSMILIAVAWAVEAVCFSAVTPAQEALVADHSGAEARGTGYGLYTLASGLGATIGPVLGGWVYDAGGTPCPSM